MEEDIRTNAPMHFARTLTALVALVGVGAFGCAAVHVDLKAPTARPDHVQVDPLDSAFALAPAIRGELDQRIVSHALATSRAESRPERDARLFTVLSRKHHVEAIASGLDGSATTFQIMTYSVRMVLVDRGGRILGSAVVKLDEDMGTLKADPRAERRLLASGVEHGLDALLGRPEGSRVQVASR